MNAPKTSGTPATGARGKSAKPETAKGDVGASRPVEGRFAGHRSATLSLPFVTAQVRAPNVRVPSRHDLGTAARGMRRKLPSRSALLFYGGLSATAVVGVIEWPVAVAIGVGGALASRRHAAP